MEPTFASTKTPPSLLTMRWSLSEPVSLALWLVSFERRSSSRSSRSRQRLSSFAPRSPRPTKADSGSDRSPRAGEVFMAGIKIKRNDTVEVIAGKDKGKRGRVLRVIADKNRVLVEHVMIVKKHVKPNPQRNIKGGIAEQESPIHISNVMLIDSEGNKTRIGSRMDGDKKVRFSKASGNAIAEKKPKK